MAKRELDFSPRGRRQSRRGLAKLLLILLLALAVVVGGILLANLLGGRRTLKKLASTPAPSYVDVQIIDVDGNSRRGEALDGLKDVVIHYIGNPGTSAQQNHDYYTNPIAEVSSHFIIGLNGEVIQCIPLNEKSSASNWRNNDTISIEVCHPDATGAFTPASYQSLVELTAWVCDLGGLGEVNIIRHYDITEKLCPLYFVENEDAWEQFKADVTAYRNGG